jgi:hypothetical protein
LVAQTLRASVQGGWLFRHISFPFTENEVRSGVKGPEKPVAFATESMVFVPFA